MKERCLAPRALVLTAGLGTRLRPLTYVRAKGAVPVNGEPLARRVAAWLAASGIRDLVFNLHHRPETVASVLGDGSDLGVRIRYSWEDPVLGSAGGPRHALPLLGAERFLIANGDTLTDLNVQDLVAEHDRGGAQVTMAVIPNPAPSKYGGVLVSDDGFVKNFTRRGTAPESYHFIGVQVAEAAVFRELPDGVPSESVGSLYPTLIASDPRSIRAFVTTASFRDIGTPADYLATSLELAAIEGDRMASSTVHVDQTARIERTALWDDVAVHAGARLIECIVGDRAIIPAGAVYERSAIVRADGRQAGPGERIEHSLLVRPL